MEYRIDDITEHLENEINISDFLLALDDISDEKYSFATPWHTKSETLIVKVGKEVFTGLYLAVCDNPGFGSMFNKGLNTIEIFDINYCFDEELGDNEVVIHS